jgi:hypothetical protein
MPLRLAALLATCLLVAGCITATDTAPARTATAIPSPPVAGPPACAKPIGDYVAIIDADAETGNLNRDVYRRITADLTGVRSHCSAGRVGPALTDLAEVKRRYGYR